MPDQAPVEVTCSVWVPSTGAGGIFPDGQLAAVHSSVIVVPGLLFQTYHPVAAEAPPYPVPGKDAGTDNPSSKLGLFRIPAGTVTPDCVTVKVCPATVRMADRAAPEFAAIPRFTCPALRQIRARRAQIGRAH